MSRSVQFGLRVVLAGTFGYAALAKIADPAAFAFAIDNFRLVPWPIAAALALYLPWLELVSAVALFFHRTRVGGLTIMTALSGLFALALASALIRGLDIACGCFGADGRPSLAWPLIRALLLLAVGCWLLIEERKQPSRVGRAANESAAYDGKKVS